MHYAASSIFSSYSATQRNSWGTLRGSTSRSCVTGKCSWGTLDRSTARSRAKHRECSWGTLRGSTPRSCASHRDGIDCYQIFIAKLVAWVAAKSSSSEEDTHTTWVATQSSPSQGEHPDLCHLGLARVPVRPENMSMSLSSVQFPDPVSRNRSSVRACLHHVPFLCGIEGLSTAMFCVVCETSLTGL